jgi:hypothetical protein
MESQNIETTAVEQNVPEVVTVPENFTQQEALQILVNAVNIAQQKGIYTLGEAEIISKAIRAFEVKGPIPASR